jgi:serine/threonine-protein kinase RsbW
VNLRFDVRLPTDAKSVPLVRGLMRQALGSLGVDDTGIEEIVLALTEACSNVVQHAGEHDEYQVDVVMDDSLCRISVIDQGSGFEDPGPASPPPSLQDGGRGLVLMRALVDRLAFVQDPDGRHRVTLEKDLTRDPAVRQLNPT